MTATTFGVVVGVALAQSGGAVRISKNKKKSGASFCFFLGKKCDGFFFFLLAILEKNAPWGLGDKGEPVGWEKKFCKKKKIVSTAELCRCCRYLAVHDGSLGILL